MVKYDILNKKASQVECMLSRLIVGHVMTSAHAVHLHALKRAH